MTAHPAIEFLQALDPSPTASFNIEHYTDLAKGMPKLAKDLLLARYPNLTLAQVAAMLPKLHQANDAGAGIFVAVNQCKGQRCKANIQRVRAVHADFDSATPDAMRAVTTTLPPSITVQSSIGRWQLYWLLETDFAAVNTIETINRALVPLGADPAAIDVSRLLRLPGFRHMKYRAANQTPLVTAVMSGHRYAVTELQKAFPAHTQSNKTTPPKQASAAGALLVNTVEINRIIGEVKSRAPALYAGKWQTAVARGTGQAFTSQSQADISLAGLIARTCRAAGITDEVLAENIEYIFDQSELAQRDKWVNRPDYRASTIAAAITGNLVSHTAPVALTNKLLASHGDIRNAIAFATHWRGKLLYVSTRSSWLRWADERWQLCEKDEQISHAKEVCAAMLNAASASYQRDPDKGKKLIQDAVAAHNLPKIQAMLKLAISEPGMAVTERELDAHPMLLGVQNGIVDLYKGRLLFNQPDMLVTRFCAAAFVEKAPCPLWLKFLNEIFMADAATMETVQRLLGYTLTGSVTEEVLVICVGYGSNGKSVLGNVIHAILAGYSTTAPPSLLVARRADDTGPRNDLAGLAGARYVSINEMQAGSRLDEQVVKQIAGREPIKARFLYQEGFEFQPTATPWMRTNHKPIVIGDDDGIWRRLVVLPFRRKFTNAEKDPQLEQKLLAERDGILQWMLTGTAKYLKDGLQLSPTILAEQASYRRESDLLGEYIDDRTLPSPNEKCVQHDLFFSWQEWCTSNGVRHGSKKSFSQRMAERGYREIKSNGQRYYGGVKLCH